MGATPAQFEHCVTIYTAMGETARPEKIDGVEVTLWEGYLTELFQQQRLPQPYFTTVMQKLKAMECVLQIKRGGGGSTSQWALLKEPTLEEFLKAPDRVKSQASKADQREQQARDVLRTVRELQSELLSEIGTINSRIDMLETQIHALAKEVQETNARHNP